jgi:hypothetical protein
MAQQKEATIEKKMVERSRQYQIYPRSFKDTTVMV